MKPIKYGSPTFLFRELCKQDLFGVLRGIADCGFEGVELFGMFGVSAQRIRDGIAELGMQVICDHIEYEEFISDPVDVISKRRLMGAKYITVATIPEDKLPGTNGFSEVLGQLRRIGSMSRDMGLQLLYHSHGYDLMHKVDGVSVLEALLDSTDPELLKFQPDLGWIQLGGGDPAYFLKKYNKRCRIIHLKDYYSAAPVLLSNAAVLGDSRGGAEYNFFEFRPSGYGVMNFPQLMPAVLACEPEWIVTDHDHSYERDNLEEMKMSLEYIKKLIGMY